MHMLTFTLFSYAGVDPHSQAAYRLAAEGLVRPEDNHTPPMIYSIKCIDFQLPDFTLGQCVSVSVCLFVCCCLTSQQHASVSQGRICTDNFTCWHNEIEVADQTFYLTQSQYTHTGPTSLSADPIMPGTWQGSHWSADF